MSPSPRTTAPLPPLPSFNQGGQPQGSSDNGMASILSGLAPIKAGVDQIMSGCKLVVQSGAIPGSEQICSQIIALATSLLPMAAQQLMQPGAGGGMGPIPAPQGPIQGQ